MRHWHISYNVFDGEELLRLSVIPLLKWAEKYPKKVLLSFSFVCQTKASDVDMLNHNLIPEVSNLCRDITADFGWYTEIHLVEPQQFERPETGESIGRLVEIHKRQIGVDSAKRLKADIVSLWDCAEVYPTKVLDKVLSDFTSPSGPVINGVYAFITSFYKYANHGYRESDGVNIIPHEPLRKSGVKQVKFLVPVAYNLSGTKYSQRRISEQCEDFRLLSPKAGSIDMTRGCSLPYYMGSINVILPTSDDMRMLHLSYCREDIKRKLVCASSSRNYLAHSKDAPYVRNAVKAYEDTSPNKCLGEIFLYSTLPLVKIDTDSQFAGMLAEELELLRWGITKTAVLTDPLSGLTKQALRREPHKP